MNNLFRTSRQMLVLALIICCGCSPKEQNYANELPISTPEAEGVSSAGVLRFVDALDQGENEIHSFVIVRHGKIISEGWWNPYGKELRHVMFSVSKSFTSVGVGLAIAENKLALTDKVASFFPESLPDTLSTDMQEMNVEDLLKMSTGMDNDPLFQAMGGAADWPNVFLSTPVQQEPGTVFKYNNMATFMLSAIVQKATGEKLFDFLKPRLFEPLGITQATWDDGPAGVTMGAIGLRIPSNDMAKFGQLLLQKGKWNGKQLIPESWIEAATSKHIDSNDPGNTNPTESNDWAQGYGYQFWRSRHNSYRADGLGGQFILVLPEKDAVVVLTASSRITQDELNVVWENLLPAMEEEPLTEDEASAAALKERIASLALSKTTSTPADSTLLSRVSGKKISLTQNDLGITALRVVMQEAAATVEFERDSMQYEITAGLDSWKMSETPLTTLNAAPRADQTQPVKLAATSTWVDANTFQLSARFVEQAIGSEVWVFRFNPTPAGADVQIEVKPIPADMPFGRPVVVLQGKVE
ncbi:MAG: serine hydrolase domain-containing protein [Cyclobacteriaceae bacterium]